MIKIKRNTMGVKEQAELEHARIELARLSGTAEIAFVTMAQAGMLDDATAAEHMDCFAPWQTGVTYKTGDLRIYGEGERRKLYRCVQGHTSQEDWAPEAAASLWAVAADPAEEWPAWSQPVSAHDAYAKGDKASHNGERWASEVNGNVWEPGVAGWKRGEGNE